jgi:F-type H+-transporting ATPase subunit delta
MNQGRVTASYARALLSWSIEKEIAFEVYNQSEQFILTLSNSPDFYYLLSTPVISTSKKLEIINKVLTNSAPNLAPFVNLVVSKNRGRVLKNIILIFHRQFREKFGLIKVTVECAKELSPNTGEAISNYLARSLGKKIELNVKINPDLIGGFILEIDDNLLDKSVKGELEEMRKKLLGIEH